MIPMSVYLKQYRYVVKIPKKIYAKFGRKLRVK